MCPFTRKFRGGGEVGEGKGEIYGEGEALINYWAKLNALELLVPTFVIDLTCNESLVILVVRKIYI